MIFYVCVCMCKHSPNFLYSRNLVCILSRLSHFKIQLFLVSLIESTSVKFLWTSSGLKAKLVTSISTKQQVRQPKKPGTVRKRENQRWPVFGVLSFSFSFLLLLFFSYSDKTNIPCFQCPWFSGLVCSHFFFSMSI